MARMGWLEEERKKGGKKRRKEERTRDVCSLRLLYRFFTLPRTGPAAGLFVFSFSHSHPNRCLITSQDFSVVLSFRPLPSLPDEIPFVAENVYRHGNYSNNFLHIYPYNTRTKHVPVLFCTFSFGNEPYNDVDLLTGNRT